MISTDIHLHIIPGVDDGAPRLEESVKMLWMSVKQGVGRVIATPHSWGIDDCGFDSIVNITKYLQEDKAFCKETSAVAFVYNNCFYVTRYTRSVPVSGAVYIGEGGGVLEHVDHICHVGSVPAS